MLRQCAWCLRLIDFAGERISDQPLPKLYEASHGMCSVCGALWMDQVFSSLTPQAPSVYSEKYSDQEITCMSQDPSPLNYADEPFVQQKLDVFSRIVCEGNAPYSSHILYPLPEGEEPV